MSVSRTNDEQTTNSPLPRPVVCFDGGNRTIQWLSPGGVVRQIPSYLKPIDPSWEDVEPDANSIVIEFDGETFALGQVAKDMGGTPTYQALPCSTACSSAVSSANPLADGLAST